MKQLQPLPPIDTFCQWTVAHSGTLTVEGWYRGKSGERVEVSEEYGEGFRTWRFLHSDILTIEEV